MCKVEIDFKKRIQDGIDGKYQGLPNGLKKFNRYIYGIQRQWYYLYGGLSGSAKTTLVDFKLLRALEYAERNNIEVTVFYYSFEINEEKKKANILACHIFNKYKVVIPPQKILGLGKNRLSEEELKLVKEELPYVDRLFSKITFRFDSMNPTGIYKELMTFFNNTGTFKYRKYKKITTDAYGKEREVEDEAIESYVHNNPERYVIMVLDHIALTKSENGKNLKETIDKLSEYIVRLRNLCGLTAIIISQFNQSLNTVERQKYKGVDLSPQQNDFKDSTNPYQDADSVIGIMNPYKMDMETCLGYDLKILKNRFRMLKLIKQRMGHDNVSIGLQFVPEGGFFKELPHPKEMTKEVYAKVGTYNAKLDAEMLKQDLIEDDWDDYHG